MAKLLSRLKNDPGSIIATTAILLPIFLLLLGAVIDLGRALACKIDLNKACMISAEETARCLDMSFAENLGTYRLSENFEDELLCAFNNNFRENGYLKLENLDYDIAGSINDPEYINVSCEAKVRCFFLRLISVEEIKVHSSANGRIKQFR